MTIGRTGLRPSSATWRQPLPEKKRTGKHLRPLNKYRHATSLQDYFDQRVVKHSGYYDTDCWQFMGTGDKDGYKQTQGSKHCKELGLSRAHQVSYYLSKGDIPDGYFVCHTCDNPGCVNPEHLFLGTVQDNVDDMMRKGRYRPAYSIKEPRVTKSIKDEVLKFKGLENCFKVGERFSISFGYVCEIWRNHAA